MAPCEAGPALGAGLLQLALQPALPPRHLSLDHWRHQRGEQVEVSLQVPRHLVPQQAARLVLRQGHRDAEGEADHQWPVHRHPSPGEVVSRHRRWLPALLTAALLQTVRVHARRVLPDQQHCRWVMRWTVLAGEGELVVALELHCQASLGAQVQAQHLAAADVVDPTPTLLVTGRPLRLTRRLRLMSYQPLLLLEAAAGAEVRPSSAWPQGLRCKPMAGAGRTMAACMAGVGADSACP